MCHLRYWLMSLLLLSLFTGASAQQNQKYVNYINKYSSLAVDQMNRYKIPASITLAQGLLESGAGSSQLALKSNNHFGIKCGSTWTGPYVVADDDAKGEHFRKYSSVKESYEDHSKFLTQNKRYASLFSLSITDYKGWAKGLKAAGYATSPTYATNLIKVIETYTLYNYDNAKSGKRISGYSHELYPNNGVYYIIVKQGDTFASLSKEFGVSKRKLRKYNDLYKGYELKVGDVIYLAKKKTKAEKKYKGYYHLVKTGETMYSISQMYGVRLKNLYKMNKMYYDDDLIIGSKLRIR